MALLRDGLIGEDEALKNATNPNELALKLKGIDASSDRTWQPLEGAPTAPEVVPAGGAVTPVPPHAATPATRPAGAGPKSGAGGGFLN